MLAHYGNFRNVKNYIVLAGKQDEGFDFRCGYYGEKMVLFAQQRGLNTCWTALTFNKKRVKEIVARRSLHRETTSAWSSRSVMGRPRGTAGGARNLEDCLLC